MGVELRRRTEHLLGIDEHAAGAQDVVDAGEQVALAGVVEVVDGQRRDDRVERTGRQPVGEIADVGRPAVAQALASLLEHCGRGVEHVQLGGRVGSGDLGAQQAGARPEVEDALRGGRAERDRLDRRVVEAVVRGDQAPARGVVVDGVGVEDLRCARVHHNEQLYVITVGAVKPTALRPTNMAWV